ncbi:PAS domain S-box-containing protein [Methanocalculus alkaliphilus]|uniref:PAS domain S-box protein n=1 Tax=Methanocalculus alkaliphilus TaxID=768730 RepID=UPI0020A1F20A|nr:PAS domain S-box protein [Methanocalculus alkaliphilus]MCP1715780.1 PAS domain S-box-containing protein [Methanocalculus alkaliphilus]
MISPGDERSAISLLYVDDEPALLEIGKLFLERTGDITVITAESAEEAMDLRKNHHFDVIVSDYQMPRMDGIAFLKHLRTAGDMTPFIIFTGRGREDVVIEALNNGADFYLQKGGNPRAQFAELINKIRYAFRRRGAERALVESEFRYRNVVLAQTELICRFRPDGEVIFVNEVYSRAFGMTVDELIGSRFKPVIHPDDHKEVAALYASLTPDHPSGIIEERIIMPDGRITWQRWSTTAIFDENGECQEYQSVGRDITELKDREAELEEKNTALHISYERLAAAEEELRQQLDEITSIQKELADTERRYQTIFEYTHAATIIINPDTTIALANDAFERVSGHTKDAVKGKSWTLFVSQSDRERMMEYHHQRRGRSGDPPRSYEFTFVDRYGNMHPCLITVGMIPESGHSVASIYDITDRKKAEEALLESETQLRVITENMTETITITDLSFQFTYVSPSIVTLRGFTVEEAMAQPLEQILTPESLRFALSTFEDAMGQERSGKPIESISLDLEEYHKDGSIIWVNNTLTFLRDTEGKPTAILIVARDVTEKKRAEETLRKSEELYSGLFDTIASGVAIYEVGNEGSSGHDYIIKDFNRMALEIEGKQKEDVVGKSLRDLRPTIDEYGLIPVFQRVWKTGVPEYFPQAIYIDDRYESWYENRVFRLGSGEVVAVYNDITEQMRAELEAEKSTKYLEAMLDGIPDIVGIQRPDHTIIRYNKAGYEILGLRPEDADGRRCYEILGRREACPDCATSLAVQSKRRETIERYCPELGRYIECTSSPILNDDGEVELIIERLHDITERIAAEQALRESEEKYRLIAENTADNIWIYGMDFKLRYISPSVLRMKGVTVEESLAQQVQDMMTPESYASLLKRFEEEMAREATGTEDPERTVFFETEEYCRDGRTILVENVARLLRDKKGEPVGILGISRDITDRKATESALKQSEAEKTAILNSMPVMLAYLDREMKVLYANKASADSIESLPDDLIGRHCFEIWHGKTEPCEGCPLVRSLESDRIEEGEVTIPDGRVFHLRGCPVYDETGEITGLIEFGMDITGRKTAEDAIHIANKKLQILSSITRHDILNQIMALQGFLVFAEEMSADPEQAGYLSEVKKAAKAIERQIEFTRNYEELGVKKPAWSAISTMIEGISDTRFPIHHVCNGYEVLADPMIEKVFTNLMDNTIRHAEGATAVEIRCEVRDGDLIIIWEDDGSGVPDDQKERIFGRGFGKNTGFGLFLSREILAITGIAISETGVYGEGARFEILVPEGAWRGLIATGDK